MKSALDNILGESEAIRSVKSLIRQVAPSDITVLITGESGVGKELVAEALHSLSRRASGPMLTLNCGAIPEGLFESEIFGHEKGSFTSAGQMRRGYFEMADQGALFLDEIGEMPLSVQVKILRVLETNSFLRVGGTSELKVDVRLIAATNKDLAMETARGRFRSDLYYRLKAVAIHLPPLRERREDIPLLAQHFAAQFAIRNQLMPLKFNNEVLDLLTRHYWEGNVRELKNFIESLAALHHREGLTPALVRAKLAPSAHTNLPVLISRPVEEQDRELIYRTLLEIKHELQALRGAVQQIGSPQRREIHFPISFTEEVESLPSTENGTPEVKFEVQTLPRNSCCREGRSEGTLDDLERRQIEKALKEYRGNRKLAARALGIGERTLYRKIKQYNLK